MGIDTIIVTYNSKKVTIKDFNKIVANNNYPGGHGKFKKYKIFQYEITAPFYAYHNINFYKNYIIISDGCRLHADHEYKIKLMSIIEEISGSQAKTAGDDIFIDIDDTINNFADPKSDLWITKNELIEINNFEHIFLDKLYRIARLGLGIRFYDKNDKSFIDLNDTLNNIYYRLEKQMPECPKVFISYSHKDKKFANRISHYLETNGIPIWMDSREMYIGDSLIQKIRCGLNEAGYVIALISKNSTNSDWVIKELDIAMNQEIENKIIKVLPALLDDSDLPGFLKGKVYLDFRKKNDFSNQCGKIIDRITKDMSSRERTE